MRITPELQSLFASLPDDFFGHVELSIQNGETGVVRVTQTHNMKNSRETRRTENGIGTSQHRK